MYTQEELQHRINEAISASENIVACMHAGDFEGAKKFDLERAEFIRMLSKCRNLDAMMPALVDNLTTLSQLNESILAMSQSLRDDVLTDLHQTQSHKASHEQYLQNKRL